RMHLSDPSTALVTLLKLQNANGGTSADACIGFVNTNSTAATDMARFCSNRTNLVNSADVDLYWSTQFQSAVNKRMTLRADGNLGLGTTTPPWTLDVASTTAFIGLTDTNAAVNQKHWTLSSNSGSLYFASSTDLYATSTIRS